MLSKQFCAQEPLGCLQVPPVSKRRLSRQSKADGEEKIRPQPEKDATSLEGGAHVEHRPDGRGCDFCTHKDDQDDPLSKARADIPLKKMWWGKTPCPTSGVTRGRVCGFCQKFFISYISEYKGYDHF